MGTSLTLGDLTAPAMLRELATREAARRGMLQFMGRTWLGGEGQPFVIGRHTRAICRALDRAVIRFKRGVSTFLLIRVPRRHGKSQIISRYFPAYALGHLSALDPDIMLVGCDEELTTGFSRNAQHIVQSPKYRQLFPACEVSPKISAAGEWALKYHNGRVHAVGIGSGGMGRGSNILIVDDWCRNREEAESPDLRRKRWDSFRNDFMSGRMPVSIVAVVGTPWHVDGLQERILSEQQTNPDFPQFDMLSFPARQKVGDKWEYLFPERFGEDWYTEQYATLTPYEAAGLMDCAPVEAAGNMASRKWFMRVPAPPSGVVVKKVRYWDSAATKTKKSDYTASGCVWRYNDGVECIQDVTMDRVRFTEVGDYILARAKVDGPDTEQWFEFEKGSMGLVGPAELAKPLIAAGLTVFLAKRPTGPKHSVWFHMLNAAHRMSGHAGGMPIVEGPCVEQFLADVDAAPSPKHDDDLDAVSGAHNAVNGVLESEEAVSGETRMDTY